MKKDTQAKSNTGAAELPDAGILVEVTPAVAESWLKKNTRNRPIGEKHVARIAEEMVSGTWIYNGETIKFAKDGSLLDGQHRLTALIRSGTRQRMLVVRGLDPVVFDRIDTHRPRTASDALFIGKVANHGRIASAVPVLVRLGRGIGTRGPVRDRMTPHEVMMEVGPGGTYEDLPEVIRELGNECKLMPRSVFDACYYAFRKIDPVMALEYMTSLRDGSGIEVMRSWLYLRERLIANRIARLNKMPEVQIMAMVIKGWSFARRGADPGKFGWAAEKEGFPAIR